MVAAAPCLSERQKNVRSLLLTLPNKYHACRVCSGRPLPWRPPGRASVALQIVKTTTVCQQADTSDDSAEASSMYPAFSLAASGLRWRGGAFTPLLTSHGRYSTRRRQGPLLASLGD